MADPRTLLLLGACITALAIFFLTSCARRNSDGDQAPDTVHNSRADSPSERLRAHANNSPRRIQAQRGRDSPSERLRAHANERDDFLMYVGVPLSNPTDWAAVSGMTEDSITVKGYGIHPINEVKAFLVAYPNGQLVDYQTHGLTLPKRFSGLTPSSKGEQDILQLADLGLGNRFLKIEYAPSQAKPNNPDHYSTTLTNISNEKIKVKRFAGYKKTSRGWELSTVTNKFYSAQEFQEWYGLRNPQWILPGQSARDPNNYGSPPLLWAYYCESESGAQFVAGAILQ